MLDYLIESMVTGGSVMVPIFLVSIWAWTLAIYKTITLKKNSGMGKDKIMELYELFRERKKEDFLNRVKLWKGSIIGRMMIKIEINRELSEVSLRHHLNELLLKSWPKIEHFLPTIAVLAAAAPLLGLLGTVSGMMHTFDIITTFGSGNPVLMAGGISEALITTQSGLVVSFPLLIYYNYLQNRKRIIQSKLELVITTLLNINYRGK